MRNYAITEEKIDVSQLIAEVTEPRAGAIATFIGTVREITHGKKTLYLEYEAYVEMAEKKLRQIGDEIQIEHPQAKVAIVHRIGDRDLGDGTRLRLASGHPRRERFSEKDCRAPRPFPTGHFFELAKRAGADA